MIDLVATEIVGKEVTAEFVWPVVAEINHRTDVRMTAIDGITTRFAGAASAVIVTRRGEQVVAEAGKIRRRVGHDEWCVVRVGLVPIMPALNHVRGATAAPIAATVCHKELTALIMV